MWRKREAFGLYFKELPRQSISKRRRGRPGKSLGLQGTAATVATAKIAVGELSVRLCDYRGVTLGAASCERDIADLDHILYACKVGAGEA